MYFKRPELQIFNNNFNTLINVFMLGCTLVANADDEVISEDEDFAPRIYMQDPATMQYPFMVAIKDGSGVVCGGALVDSQTIVTAAHCALLVQQMTSRFRFVLGAFDLNAPNQVERTPTQCWVADGYKKGYPKSPNDIGLCRFDKQVKYSSTIRNICISKTTANKVSVMLIGYGRIDGINHTNYLQYAMGKTLPNKKCREKHIADVQICAILHNKEGSRVEQAHGDSGGPLFSQSGGKPNLIGVVSYNYDFAEANGAALPDFEIPGVYTRASCYVESFLQKHAKIDTNC